LESKVSVCAHTVVIAASMAFSAVVIAALPWKPPAAICDRPRPVGHAGDSQFACAGFVEVDRQVVARGVARQLIDLRQQRVVVALTARFYRPH
jgi:hypothetical protein